MKNHKAKKKKSHCKQSKDQPRQKQSTTKTGIILQINPLRGCFFFLRKQPKIEKICRREKEVSLSSKMFSIVLQSMCV
jgi:hypothetical protein